ncbi:putative membrane protein YccC [Microbacterium endophyticum]|uniref:Putative membrane protein YccC n=1 Tax=Microbacterium endophyticum TaxID=1526412 RepID=A0A7W4YND7_9MICO|nr:potassium transporter Trk [Microbacterium endophyticum]MBB2977093.1 putative membrane protein YccC [Microbacterium endophyticum]NIK36113.1 putative membrane protein YccC [Microbacterium endophyticum]
MADQASTPQNPVEGSVSDPIETVTVRRSPRYGIFLLLGAGFGILVAMILTFAFNGTDEVSTSGVTYSDTQVFGFLALFCGAAGILLGGVVALVLGRVVGRRTLDLRAEHAIVRTQD